MLALATAAVHIYLGAITHVMVVTQPEATAAAGGAAALGFFAALFYLDGLGYIVLTEAFYHPAFARFRRLTRWALIALTAATIVAYFALIQGQYDAIGIRGQDRRGGTDRPARDGGARAPRSPAREGCGIGAARPRDVSVMSPRGPEPDGPPRSPGSQRRAGCARRRG